MAATTVGLSCQGEVVGRHGIFSLLVLSTHEDVFVFEILALGLQEIKYGLWAVLQRLNLVKVVFDIRQLSDILHHQFQLNLEKIFDIFAAHKVVTNWSVESQIVISLAPNLRDLVRYYLNLSDDIDLGLTPYSPHDQVWRTRSLSPTLLLMAAKYSICVVEVADVLEPQLNLPIEMAGQVLLDEIRQLDDEKAKQAILMPHITPDCMKITLPAWRRLELKPFVKL